MRQLLKEESQKSGTEIGKLAKSLKEIAELQRVTPEQARQLARQENAATAQQVQQQLTQNILVTRQEMQKLKQETNTIILNRFGNLQKSLPNEEDLEEIAESIQQVRQDLEKTGMKNVVKRSSVIANVLWLLGVVFGIGTLYLLFANFGKPISIFSLVYLAVMALITITMLFAATVM